MTSENLSVIPEIQLTRKGALAHLRLHRVDRRNAITMPMFQALADSLAIAQADDAIRALVLSGEGSDFCVGHDLKAFTAWPQAAQDPVPQFLHALVAFNKPLVMAVQGNAIGIGTTMLLHADWVVCTETARLRMPFADLDIGPEAASSLLLTQAVGAVRARRLLLGGESLSGAQAFEWGLVCELAKPEQLLESASKTAEQLGERQPLVRQLRQWQLGEEAQLHHRIDEEISFINARIRARKTESTEAGAVTP